MVVMAPPRAAVARAQPSPLPRHMLLLGCSLTALSVTNVILLVPEVQGAGPRLLMKPRDCQSPRAGAAAFATARTSNALLLYVAGAICIILMVRGWPLARTRAAKLSVTNGADCAQAVLSVPMAFFAGALALRSEFRVLIGCRAAVRCGPACPPV
jgi:hypothetical protein